MSAVPVLFLITVSSIIAVIVLLNVGFFTSHWITMQETIASNSTNSPTRTCHHGLFYSRDCPKRENVFDKTIIGLAATSVSFTTFPLFLFVCFRFITRCGLIGLEHDYLECSSCCFRLLHVPIFKPKIFPGLCFFSYTAGGLIGLVSAIMVGAKYDHDLLGWSFFMTVAANTVSIVQVVILAYSECTCQTEGKLAKIFDDDNRRLQNYM